MKQKGFTLLELLVVLAITAVLITGTIVSLQQVVWGSFRSKNQVTALTDVDQAALAIKRDLTMTQITSLTDGDPVPQSSVTLSWADYASTFAPPGSNIHTSIYALSGTNLLRTYDDTTSIVGRHITFIGFTQNGEAINFTITATSSGIEQRSETLQFTGYLRTEPLE